MLTIVFSTLFIFYLYWPVPLMKMAFHWSQLIKRFSSRIIWFTRLGDYVRRRSTYGQRTIALQCTITFGNLDTTIKNLTQNQKLSNHLVPI